MAQTVVITGANAGIGRAAARLFAERGDRIGLIARGSAGLNAAADEVKHAGGIPYHVEADLADFGQGDAAAHAIEEQLVPVQVWVNCGFTSVFAPFGEISLEEFRRVTDVSYLGFVHGTMAALNLMRPRDAGAIVQVGSALGERSIPLQSAYCEARDLRFHLIAALRTAARRIRNSDHAGADARGEHPAVRRCSRSC